MISNETILVTGGTGSFGKRFVEMTLKKYSPARIIVFSRDEMKQWDMQRKYADDPRVEFVIGDVRDKDRLLSVSDGIDLIVHAAATKIVPTAELNPFECIRTNIDGAINVIDAARRNCVKRVVALSTDKASNPINLYGATKLASDKLFIAANSPISKNKTRFSVVRYGNVMGSRGSVIPLFLSLKDENDFPITDPRMTRFMITLEQAIDLVWLAVGDMEGGEIYVRKTPSMTIGDIAKAVDPLRGTRVIGIRPGEKIHEQMIGSEDAPFTYEYADYFKILPSINGWNKDTCRIKNGSKVCDDFIYTSENNLDWMTTQSLSEWISQNRADFGSI
jgi:UDP-N-acetylglucosamine 4,6-dehydratase